MQPYQPDFSHQQQGFAHEQGYQHIPEGQANPVFWHRRRRDHFDVIFPVLIPYQPFPFYPYTFPYPYLYYPFPYGF